MQICDANWRHGTRGYATRHYVYLKITRPCLWFGRLKLPPPNTSRSRFALVLSQTRPGQASPAHLREWASKHTTYYYIVLNALLFDNAGKTVSLTSSVRNDATSASATESACNYDISQPLCASADKQTTPMQQQLKLSPVCHLSAFPFPPLSLSLALTRSFSRVNHRANSATPYQ